jgi:hypothetical protein
MQIRVRDTEFVGQSNGPRDRERISCYLGVESAFYLYMGPLNRESRDVHKHGLCVTPTYVAVKSPRWAADLTLTMAFFERVIRIQATQWKQRKLWSDLDLHLLRVRNRMEIIDQTRNPPGEITTIPDTTQLRFVDEDNTEGGHDERGICPKSPRLSTPSDQI